MSESGRSFNPRHEDALLEHYHILKGFLGASLGQDAAAKSTRARDKLLRLSPTQFHELSTDVYDELLRREDERQRRSPDVPRYLLPMKTFHPKRNQARQKLSTLPPERFKQLATDVYFELERRVPRLGGASIDRAASPAMSTASSYRGGPRGPPPPGMRGPQGQSRPGSRGPGGRGPPPERAQFPARSSSNDYGRPLPKTFQSNTIVPNKSTMVEGDDTEDEDPMGSPPQIRGMVNQEQTQAFESQIAELQAKVAGLEASLREKDVEIHNFESNKLEHDKGMITERETWNKARSELEQQVNELQGTANAHLAEMDRTHQNHTKREAGLRDQLEQTVNELQGQIDHLNSENSLLKLQGGPSSDQGAEEWREQVEMLQDELDKQRRVTEEVRENATHFLQEMRALSEQSEAALEKEEQLQGQIRALQAEVEDWKSRYAKTKTELRTLKASSIGLPLQNMSRDALASRHQLLSQEGLVNDMDVTNYQMSIDELLQTARQNSVDNTLDKMKVVIGHVQHITNNGKSDYTGLPSPAESPNPMSPQLNGSPPTQATLKARVARNATGLITATRNYVSADGLSPVSLIDAAAANLTAAVIDYVKTVGIKASNSHDLRADMDMDDGYEMLPSTTHVPQLKTKLLPSNNNNNNVNGGNGWFSRLKGSFDSSYSDDMSPASPRDDESDYNSYR
ncbi:Spa2-like protein [Elsinoe fawcettii]|nr:Spa2-like protein [Elsinoe fawcettii]